MARVRVIEIDDQLAVGRRLRAARDAAGLSLRQLAFPGCSAPYISAIEHGRRVPSLQVLTALGDRLGVSADYLATGAERIEEAAITEAEVALLLGDIEAAESAFARAREQTADPKIQARCEGGLGVILLRRAKINEGIAALERARELAGASFLLLPTLVDALGRAYASRTDFEAAVELYTAARDAAAERRDRPGVLRFNVLLANTFIDLGDLSHSSETLALALHDAGELRDPLLRARVLWSQSRLHTVEGRHDLAAEFAERALESLRAAEDDHAVALAGQLLAYIELERGRPERALELLEEAAPVMARSDDAIERAVFDLERCRALLELGREEEAREILLAAGPVLRDWPSADAGRYFVVVGDLYRRFGENEDALTMYELAIESLRDHRNPHLVRAYQHKADLLEELGRQAEALEALKEALAVQAGSAAR
jgi:tetratricopeptide (TPR) repeat protein